MTPAKAAKRPTLFLIDAPAIYYRAYFAFIRNPLITARGENTSATFGFTNSVVKILREEKPDFIAVAFDTKEPTFRHDKYAEYKANREQMPDDLVAQLPRIQEAVEALRLTSFAIEGFEADDIIATLARQAERDGVDVWIVSPDKDLCQLVNEHVRIYNAKKGLDAPERLDRDGVKERLGVYPEQVVDFLALTGDSSDNVPGIPGVGPKTAISLLEQFSSLENILKHTSEIAAKGMREKVEAGADSAILSKELVTIHTEAPVSFDRERLASRQPDPEKARKLFTELQFTSLLKSLDLSGSSSDTAATATKSRKLAYHTVDTLEKLESLISTLEKKTEIVIDTETTSVNPMAAELVGVSLCSRAGEAWYIPIAHSKGPNIPKDDAIRLLSRICNNPKIEKVGQNIKYDHIVLARAGIPIQNVGFDTMLAAYVINPSARSYSLDALALDHLDYRMQPISDLIGSGKAQTSFADVGVAEATFYSCEDADYTYRLRGLLGHDIERLKLDELFYKIEIPLIPALVDMEMTGVCLDTAFLKKMSGDLEKNMDALERDIYKSAGAKFNINSTQQLAKILFEDLKLPTKGKTTKKTGYSTDVRVLEELASLHPLPKLILDFRQLNKLKSTYVDALPALINPSTGRVHTTYNQTIAATGRLSSTDPNLQNIPIRTDIGREIRRAFVPSASDRQILSADYSQIELRVLAHISGDKGLLDAFKRGDDVHARTAAEVFGVDIKSVTAEQRRVAKTANFAVIYGVTAYGLSQQSDMDVSASKEFIDTYFKRYKGIKKYIDDTVAQARKQKYVETLSGRRRYINDLDSTNFAVRQFAERTAINTRIQGTAADMIKIAMITIHKNLGAMKSKMILQVHDELVFDAVKSELKELKALVKDGMENALPLKAPVVVDIGVGDNWLDAK